MKIILQPEAKTISDRELFDNQKYLINLIDKIPGFSTNFRSNSCQQVKDINRKATS